MKSIAVFCGSKDGYIDVYREEAYRVGGILAERGIRLVYGGAKIGVMGAVADGVLNNGGEVIGVIPQFLLNKEVAHENLTDLIIVDTMHQRKLKMYELSDAMMTLPGGWGTMEELFETLTWGQLGMHNKPMGILNINGYYDSLKVLMTMMVHEGFLSEWTKKMVIVNESITDLLEMMEQYDAPELQQFLDKGSS